MLTMDPTQATLCLQACDIDIVKRFREAASNKMAGIDLASLGVPGLTAEHKFEPFRPALPGAALNNHRALFDWIDSVEVPAADDRPNVRMAKLQDIDKLGRLIAVADLRLSVESPSGEPTLSDLAAAEAGGTASFADQVNQQVDSSQSASPTDSSASPVGDVDSATAKPESDDPEADAAKLTLSPPPQS